MTDRCNCDDCVADPSLTCSYTGEDVSVMAVYIANAYRGNMILSPGGPEGLIGGLLHELTPPQHYSHMGIMVADYDLIRHATFAEDRITSDEYFAGNVLGVSVPLHGVNSSHLKYGWPGTITQSAEQVLYADRYGHRFSPPGQKELYRGSDLVDPESPSKRAYQVAELSFDGIVDGGRFFPALVVKPCFETEAVHDVLKRVADQAISLYGHYRFYCYSNGSFAKDVNQWGPPINMPAAKPRWDPVAMRWQDWSDPAQVQFVNVPTVPAVCSSFVWQAVEEVKKGAPTVILDWAKTIEESLGDEEGSCHRTVAPEWEADVLDDLTEDGLYLYDESSRKQAAQSLHDSLSEKVFTSLKRSLVDGGGVGKAIGQLMDIVGRGAFILAVTGGAAAGLVALLGPITGGILAGGVDTVLAEQLIELLYDMPEDIANQVCNAFAFDCYPDIFNNVHCHDAEGNSIDDIDSDNWSRAPGVGRAVSPDNIHMFWDAPIPSQRPRETVFGMYGYNMAVQPVVAVVRRPICTLVPSTGTATIAGLVRYRRELVANAHVNANCQRGVTGIKGEYALTVRSGAQYKVVARFETGGIVAYGEKTTGSPSGPPIANGSTIFVDIDVIDPPVCLREIVVSGTIRVDDVYITGADHGEKSFQKSLWVQYGVAIFKENTGAWEIDPDDPVGALRRTDVVQVGASSGDSDGELKIEVAANIDLSVSVTLTGTIEDLSQVVGPFPVGRDAQVSIPEFNLDTGGSFNDRAYFRDITISNGGATAI